MQLQRMRLKIVTKYQQGVCLCILIHTYTYIYILLVETLETIDPPPPRSRSSAGLLPSLLAGLSRSVLDSASFTKLLMAGCSRIVAGWSLPPITFSFKQHADHANHLGGKIGEIAVTTQRATIVIATAISAGRFGPHEESTHFWSA